MARITRLTDNQREILLNLAHGSTVAEIAKASGRSEHTIKRTKERIFNKLGAHTTIEAINIAMSRGEINMQGYGDR